MIALDIGSRVLLSSRCLVFDVIAVVHVLDVLSLPIKQHGCQKVHVALYRKWQHRTMWPHTRCGHNQHNSPGWHCSVPRDAWSCRTTAQGTPGRSHTGDSCSESLVGVEHSMEGRAPMPEEAEEVHRSPCCEGLSPSLWCGQRRDCSPRQCRPHQLDTATQSIGSMRPP